MLNAPVQAIRSFLENGNLMDINARSWSYVTLGFGHDGGWWRQFCLRLRMAGYDGWLSIEHEDVTLNSLEGLEKFVALLRGVMPVAPFRLQTTGILNGIPWPRRSRAPADAPAPARRGHCRRFRSENSPFRLPHARTHLRRLDHGPAR